LPAVAAEPAAMLYIWRMILTLHAHRHLLPPQTVKFIAAHAWLCAVVRCDALQGKLYPGSMYSEDVSFDVPLAIIEVCMQLQKGMSE
jgi:hypothetical protein